MPVRSPPTPPARSADDGEPGPAAGPPSAPDALSPQPAAPASVRELLKPVRQSRPAKHVHPGKSASARQSTRPPSVREVAGAVEVTMPTREVTVDDQVWMVHQKGSGRVGYGCGAGARILSVGVEAPGDRENPVATRYVLARRLDDVAEDDLVSLVREVAQAPDPDPASSRRGERGARRGGRSRSVGRPRRGRRR